MDIETGVPEEEPTTTRQPIVATYFVKIVLRGEADAPTNAMLEQAVVDGVEEYLPWVSGRVTANADRTDA